MAVEERRRSELYQAVSEVLGPEHAMTMFELFPPPSTDLATQQGVDLRFDAIDQRFQAVDQRFDTIDQRFQAVDRRFDAIDQRFDAVDQRFDDLRRHVEARLDDRINALREELLAAFRGELVTAVAGQTRAVILAVVTTTVAIGGLAVTFARVL